MRIIEPASSPRTIELLKYYFDISYAERTVYRLLPKLIANKNTIEIAAYQTARTHFKERRKDSKPIVVADAAMLSQENMSLLEDEGYQYIVGARLANVPNSFIDTLTANLTKQGIPFNNSMNRV
jgi:hypothetical protein